MTSIRTLLIVEDNRGDARLIREMLDEDGTTVSSLIYAASLGEAEEYLAKNAIDFILLDLGLPDARGVQAITRVRAIAPDIPLVVLTGIDDDEVAAQSLQQGAQDYLIKGQIESRGLLRSLRYAGERKRLERLKDGFVSTISHELRTPLTSISGSLEILVSGTQGAVPVELARLLQIAQKNCSRLVRLVNDILDIEKLESGRLTFQLSRIDAKSLVEDAVEANQAFADGLDVQINITGVTGGVAYVCADADRLTQAVTNLLSNAVKFSKQGGEVAVTVEKAADLVRIAVRDHGPGIAAEFRSRIFQRFSQADATNTRRPGGAGLGLYIVRQLVHRLGGEVSFADAPDGGTVFRIDLPIWGGNADLSHELRTSAAELAEAETNIDGLVEEARDRLTHPLGAEQF
jgi:signal transduction histidine kinase